MSDDAQLVIGSRFSFKITNFLSTIREIQEQLDSFLETRGVHCEGGEGLSQGSDMLTHVQAIGQIQCAAETGSMNVEDASHFMKLFRGKVVRDPRHDFDKAPFPRSDKFRRTCRRSGLLQKAAQDRMQFEHAMTNAGYQSCGCQ